MTATNNPDVYKRDRDCVCMLYIKKEIIKWIFVVCIHLNRVIF